MFGPAAWCRSTDKPSLRRPAISIPRRGGPERRSVRDRPRPGAPRSALGPCRSGPERTSVVINGRQRFGGTAGRWPFGSSSWDNADERFGLWSRRSEISYMWPGGARILRTRHCGSLNQHRDQADIRHQRCLKLQPDRIVGLSSYGEIGSRGPHARPSASVRTWTTGRTSSRTTPSRRQPHPVAGHVGPRP